MTLADAQPLGLLVTQNFTFSYTPVSFETMIFHEMEFSSCFKTGFIQVCIDKFEANIIRGS